MANKKNVKSKIWVYAVVLFTSAFIVLLITAYSQIKMNRNIVDFRNQISNQQNEKNKYQLNFATAQEMNNKLTEENEKLKADNESLQEAVNKANSDIQAANDSTGKKLGEYEKLSAAQEAYIKGDIVASARILKSIDVLQFNEKAKASYEFLSEKALLEAGKQLFDEGYKLYSKGDYNAALEKLTLSRELSPKADYSDNCLYYLAYAQQRTGNTAAAVTNMKLLLNEYPESSFINYAKSFIEKYDGIKP